MAERKLNTLTPRSPTTAGIGHVTPNPSASVPNPFGKSDKTDPVRAFMRDNPAGKLVDPPEETGTVTTPFLEDGEVPPDLVDGLTGSRPDDAVPVVTDAVTPPVETPLTEKPAVTPAPAAPAAAAPAATEKPAAPVEQPKTYAPDEKIVIRDGVEPWTRAQIDAGLTQRAELIPRAAEADQFRTLFGYDFTKAETEWKPVLEIMRSDPERTVFLDQALHAPKDELEYLRKSSEFYNSPEGRTMRGLSPEAPPKTEAAKLPAAPAARDARVDQLYAQAVKQRIGNELSETYRRYPFMQTNLEARNAMLKMADMLRDTDIKNGKAPLEARGLFDVLEMNKAAYDAMKIAYDAKNAPVVAPPVVEPNPNVDKASLVTGGGPGPTVRPTPPPVYKGNPENAVAEFTKHYPTGN
jgi:hypothetical protein